LKKHNIRNKGTDQNSLMILMQNKSVIRYSSFKFSSTFKARFLFDLNNDDRYPDSLVQHDSNYFDATFSRAIHHLLKNNDNNKEFPFINGFIQ
jgi:hypothetical protein